MKTLKVPGFVGRYSFGYANKGSCSIVKSASERHQFSISCGDDAYSTSPSAHVGVVTEHESLWLDGPAARPVKAALARAVATVEGRSGAVYVLDHRGESLAIEAVHGSRPLGDHRVPTEAAWVVRNVMPLLGTIGMCSVEQLPSTISIRTQGDSAWVPVLVDNVPIGVLEVSTDDAEFGLGTIGVLSRIAAEASAVVFAAAKERESFKAFLDTIESLAQAVDARDPYTFGHSKAVKAYSVEIGTALGLPHEAMVELSIAASFHDIGKISVPDAVLLKPGRLTEDERDVIQIHPVSSDEILRPLWFGKVSSIVRHHHERLDGRGYPDRLSGDEIPDLSKIIAVADSFDAMSSDRPYRKAQSLDYIMGEFSHERGGQFDSDVVDAFLTVLDRYIRSEGTATPTDVDSFDTLDAPCYVSAELEIPPHLVADAVCTYMTSFIDESAATVPDMSRLTNAIAQYCEKSTSFRWDGHQIVAPDTPVSARLIVQEATSILEAIHITASNSISIHLIEMIHEKALSTMSDSQKPLVLLLLAQGMNIDTSSLSFDSD